MNSLLDILPGETLPISAIPQALKNVWGSLGTSGLADSKRPDFRAVQMNLIVHFGSTISNQSALDAFNTALQFSETHPCRIIVLCPDINDSSTTIRAKLFSQCYIGSGSKNISASDAIILSYKEKESHFLEYQVSIWLDNDLPTYHWLHGVDAQKIGSNYLQFLTQCTKVIYDSALAQDHYSSVAWPSNNPLKDLTFFKTLSARQSLAQFLSAYEPNSIVDNLLSIKLNYSSSLKAEGLCLLDWTEEALRSCCQISKLSHAIKYEKELTDSSLGHNTLVLNFKYQNERFFRWTYTPEKLSGLIEANLGKGNVHYPLQILPINLQHALNLAILS